MGRSVSKNNSLVAPVVARGWTWLHCEPTCASGATVDNLDHSLDSTPRPVLGASGG